MTHIQQWLIQPMTPFTSDSFIQWLPFTNDSFNQCPHSPMIPIKQKINLFNDPIHQWLIQPMIPFINDSFIQWLPFINDSLNDPIHQWLIQTITHSPMTYSFNDPIQPIPPFTNDSFNQWPHSPMTHSVNDPIQQRKTCIHCSTSADMCEEVAAAVWWCKVLCQFNLQLVLKVNIWRYAFKCKNIARKLVFTHQELV